MTDASKDVPLAPATVRNLSDKLYEKRKLGALEVEQLVKELAESKDLRKLVSITDYLSERFVHSSNGNHRKGGLIALAAVAIGLGPEIYMMLTELVPPVLKCFTDQDSRVRYYACESMYNVAKVGRGKLLVYFNEIFDGLCKLAADPDPNVKNGSKLLDRLIKDIVADNECFDIEKFIPLLQERIYVINSFVRSFLIGWINVLDSVPDINLIVYLPKFLDGLFNMLSEKKKDIRREAEKMLAEFLREIREGKNPAVDLGEIVRILIPHCLSADDFTRLIAITWINEFIGFAGESLLQYAADLVKGILPSLSDEVLDVQEEAVKANDGLFRLLSKNGVKSFPLNTFLTNVTMQLLNQYVPTRLAALRWVLVLHRISADLLAPYLDLLFPALLKSLSDVSEEVVRLDLEVMAKIATNEEKFHDLLNSLVSLFLTDRQLLEHRGSLIVRQLCLFINPEKIYRCMARILEAEEDVEFANVMIHMLNLILLASRELFELRQQLKETSGNVNESDSSNLFVSLYRPWCHNPIATLSLCLLAQSYEHATALVFKFGELEITVSFLVEIDKLVQLLESPIFISLRLQLLEPDKHPFLFKCLYGLLMLLPQSTAFDTLRTRLNCISTLGILHLIPKLEGRQKGGYDTLVEHFVNVQKRHASHRKLEPAVKEESEVTGNARRVTRSLKEELETPALAETEIESISIHASPSLSTLSSSP